MAALRKSLASKRTASKLGLWADLTDDDDQASVCTTVSDSGSSLEDNSAHSEHDCAMPTRNNSLPAPQVPSYADKRSRPPACRPAACHVKASEPSDAKRTEVAAQPAMPPGVWNQAAASKGPSGPSPEALAQIQLQQQYALRQRQLQQQRRRMELMRKRQESAQLLDQAMLAAMRDLGVIRPGA